jgi:hypothetical protein
VCRRNGRNEEFSTADACQGYEAPPFASVRFQRAMLPSMSADEPIRGLLEPPEEEASESWFESTLEPWFDRCLKFLEFLTVAGLAVVVITIAIYETCWVLWGHLPSDRQTRMQDALTVLNGNWKIGLLLLVPLFYRTIRVFLERVEKFAGMEAPRKPVAISSPKPNPTLKVNSTGGKG